MSKGDEEDSFLLMLIFGRRRIYEILTAHGEGEFLWVLHLYETTAMQAKNEGRTLSDEGTF